MGWTWSSVVTQVQTFYEKMFLEMGLPITYMAFTIDHNGPYAFPGEAFDHQFWLEAEGPRRSFGHQPASQNSKLSKNAQNDVSQLQSQLKNVKIGRK